MAEKLTYSIRDLEELSGIPAHTIRTWERRYCLFSPTRGFCNVRSYNADDITYMHQLTLLLKQGHRISTLAAKSREEISRLAKEASLTTRDSDVTETLCVALQEFDTTKIESLISCYIRKEGFDKALTSHFVPFLDQMGFLLLSGVLQLIHAQIFYAILRQKIHASLDSIVQVRDSERWVLIQDDDTVDTIYRDIMQYVLRKAGRQTIACGTLNRDALQQIFNDAKPDGICLVAVGEHAGDWLGSISKSIPRNILEAHKVLVLIQGKTLEFVNNSQIPGVVIYAEVKEAFNHFAES